MVLEQDIWFISINSLIVWGALLLSLGLCVVGFMLHDSDNRFRAFSIAALLFYIVLGKFVGAFGLGWDSATVIWLVLFWMLAIVGSRHEKTDFRDVVPSHNE